MSEMIQKDIIIIGAGPAGMTAAIYGQRAGKSTIMIKAKAFGSKIINTPDIENYPGFEHISGFEYAQKLYNQATAIGAELVQERRARALELPPEQLSQTSAELDVLRALAERDGDALHERDFRALVRSLDYLQQVIHRFVALLAVRPPRFTASASREAGC